MSQFTRRWESFYARVRTDIFELAAEMGFSGPINQPGGLSWQQADFLQAVQIATHGYPSRLYSGMTKRGQSSTLGKKWIAVKSGQGPGKTTASTIAGVFRTLQVPGTFTMVTAPTMAQCREVWLTELRRVLAKSNPILRDVINPTRSKVVFKGNPDWNIQFCTSNKTEASQGRHHPNMTWIAEEGSGISRALCVQIEGTLSNLGKQKALGADPNDVIDRAGDGMFIMIGNPNTRDCYFFDCFNHDAHNWWTYTMNAEESPAHIVSPERNRLLAEKYGKNSDIYRVRVQGEFPWASPNCVIGSEDLMACTRTDIYECMRIGRYQDGKLVMPFQIGIDLARYGNDESTIYARQGNAIVKWESFNKVDPQDVADYAIRMRAELGWPREETWMVPDAGGMGQGVMRNFWNSGCKVLEFHNGGSSSKYDYWDKATEALFTLGEKAKRRCMHIPNDNRLIQQLSTRQYKVDDDRGKAKMRIESKEKYVERVRREGESAETVNSPDRADGLMMAMYDELTVSGNIATANR